MDEYQFKIGDLVERINESHPQYPLYAIGYQFVLDGKFDDLDHFRMKDKSRHLITNLKLVKVESIGILTDDNYYEAMDRILAKIENI